MAAIMRWSSVPGERMMAWRTHSRVAVTSSAAAVKPTVTASVSVRRWGGLTRFGAGHGWCSGHAVRYDGAAHGEVADGGEGESAVTAAVVVSGGKRIVWQP